MHFHPIREIHVWIRGYTGGWENTVRKCHHRLTPWFPSMPGVWLGSWLLSEVNSWSELAVVTMACFLNYLLICSIPRISQEMPLHFSLSHPSCLFFFFFFYFVVVLFSSSSYTSSSSLRNWKYEDNNYRSYCEGYNIIWTKFCSDFMSTSVVRVSFPFLNLISRIVLHPLPCFFFCQHFSQHWKIC